MNFSFRLHLFFVAACGLSVGFLFTHDSTLLFLAAVTWTATFSTLFTDNVENGQRWLLIAIVVLTLVILVISI